MSLYKLLHSKLCPIVNMKRVAHKKIFIHNSTISSLNNNKVMNLVLKKQNRYMHVFKEMRIEYEINDMAKAAIIASRDYNSLKARACIF